MSAILINEEMCTDEFKDVVEGPLKMTACEKTEKVTKFLSNALALINSYARTLNVMVRHIALWKKN